MTGVVASKSVTEAFKGTLRTVGNRLVRAISEGCLTVRRTCRAGRKLGYSDPVVLYGRAIAQRIKGTPGINLDVGSSHPGAGEGPKGWAVRPLKWHASWVQNVARQFGPYLLRAQEI